MTPREQYAAAYRLARLLADEHSEWLVQQMICTFGIPLPIAIHAVEAIHWGDFYQRNYCWLLRGRDPRLGRFTRWQFEHLELEVN